MRQHDPFARWADSATLGFTGETATAVDTVLAQVAAAAVERDRVGGDLREDVRALAALGVTAARLSVRDGGLGFTYPAFVDVLIAVARADSSLAQSLRSHASLAESVARTRAAGLPAEWVGEIAAGDVFAGATTETGSGTTGSVGTTIHPDDDGVLRISGSKYYTTGSGIADWLTVLVSDEHGSHLSATVRADAPGVVRRDDWDGVGQRLTTSGTVEFHDVVVEPGSVRRGEGGPGISTPNVDAVLQLHHLATLAGIAIRVHDDVIAWLRDRRRHFSHASAATPADDPQLQERVGRIEAIASSVSSLVRDAARVLDGELDRAPDQQGAAAHRIVTQAQVVVPGLVLESAQMAFDLGGGSLVDARLGLDRHWRNARTLANHNPVHLKARALGASALRGDALPGIWYVGTSA